MIELRVGMRRSRPRQRHRQQQQQRGQRHIRVVSETRRETGWAGCIEFQALNTKIATLSLDATLPSTSLFIDYPCPAFGIVATPLTRERADPMDNLSETIEFHCHCTLEKRRSIGLPTGAPPFTANLVRFVRLTNRKAIPLPIQPLHGLNLVNAFVISNSSAMKYLERAYGVDKRNLISEPSPSIGPNGNR